MPMRCGVALVLAAAVLLTAGRAQAQDLEEPRERQGYFVAGGMHAALNYNRDEGKGLGPWPGFGTTIRLGQMLTRRLGVGLQIDTSGVSGDGVTASLLGFGLGGQVEIARNLALHAGIGLGVLSVDDPEEDELSGGYGAAYSLALTYDWFPVTRRTGGWAFTPGLRLRAVPSNTIDAFGLMLGLEITYWSGLPRNQLALPDSEAYSAR